MNIGDPVWLTVEGSVVAALVTDVRPQDDAPPLLDLVTVDRVAESIPTGGARSILRHRRISHASRVGAGGLTFWAYIAEPPAHVASGARAAGRPVLGVPQAHTAYGHSMADRILIPDGPPGGPRPPCCIRCGIRETECSCPGGPVVMPPPVVIERADLERDSTAGQETDPDLDSSCGE